MYFPIKYTVGNKTVSIQNSDSSGYGNLEIGGPDGGFIDLKSPFNDDYDLRMIHDGVSKIISKSSLLLFSNDTTALTIDTSQNSTFAGNVDTPQLVINGISGIYDSGSSGADLRANLRIVANLSTSVQDGMYINYGSTGGVVAHCRFLRMELLKECILTRIQVMLVLVLKQVHLIDYK